MNNIVKYVLCFFSGVVSTIIFGLCGYYIIKKIKRNEKEEEDKNRIVSSKNSAKDDSSAVKNSGGKKKKTVDGKHFIPLDQISQTQSNNNFVISNRNIENELMRNIDYKIDNINNNSSLISDDSREVKPEQSMRMRGESENKDAFHSKFGYVDTNLHGDPELEKEIKNQIGKYIGNDTTGSEPKEDKDTNA